MLIPPAPVEKAPMIKIEGKEDEYRASRWNGGDSLIGQSPFQAASPPDSFRIPCPNGHLLEATPEMLGKFAMCPQCQAKFKLDRKQSLEFLASEEERLVRKEARVAKSWLHWTIVAAVLTLMGVAILFALATAG